MPVIAVQQLHRGPEVVGFLFAAPAAGALLVTLVSGPTHRGCAGRATRSSGRWWPGAPRSPRSGSPADVSCPALFFLAVAGAADVVSAIFRSTILQVTVPDRLRGRLGAVFFIVVTGGPKLGDIEAGLVASAFTATISVVTGGIAMHHRRVRSRRASIRSSPRTTRKQSRPSRRRRSVAAGSTPHRAVRVPGIRPDGLEPGREPVAHLAPRHADRHGPRTPGEREDEQRRSLLRAGGDAGARTRRADAWRDRVEAADVEYEIERARRPGADPGG